MQSKSNIYLFSLKKQVVHRKEDYFLKEIISLYSISVEADGKGREKKITIRLRLEKMKK